jgi:hypothetical protein
VFVGIVDLYELKDLEAKVPIKGHVLFECDRGYALSDGPLGKHCEDSGQWVPTGDPRYFQRNVKCEYKMSVNYILARNCESNDSFTSRCTKIDSPDQRGRSKRRAIKPGGRLWNF